MKQKLLLLLVCISMSMMLSTTAYAAEGEENGFLYEVNQDAGVTITGYIGTETNVVIPQTIAGQNVTAIGERAFQETDIVHVVVPEGVCSIGYQAFANCEMLERIQLPASITDMAYKAFASCPKLKTAGPVSGDYNIEFSWDIAIPDDAFYHCDSLEEFDLPETIRSIGKNAFCNCINLLQIDFPNDLREIGDYAFSGCDSLVKVAFPDQKIKVNWHVLDGCDNLEKVIIPENVIWNYSLDTLKNCPKLITAGPIGGDYSIEFGWKEVIPDCAFRSCKWLKSVVLPNTIRRISQAAFYGCSSLTELELPESLQEIANTVFYECTSLKSIEIPDGVEMIWGYTFYGCSNLEHIYIPKSVHTITNYDAFEGCYRLTITGYAGSAAHTFAEEYGIPFVALPEMNFVDVKEDDWFYKSVKYVFENGLMLGTSDTTYNPLMLLSRAQFAVILYRINGSPEVEYTAKFADVPDNTWYTNAVLWANAEGVINGYPNGLFGSEDNISREQMALMMYRYANTKGYDTSVKAELSHFPDASKVSGYAQEALEWAVGNGIITGKGTGNLDPLGEASRAECATIIMRFMKLYDR